MPYGPTVARAWQHTRPVPLSEEFKHSAAGGAYRLRRATPRLVSRLFTHAPAALRVRVLDRLLRPLSNLSLMGVASGAFRAFLDHEPHDDDLRDLTLVTQYSGDEIEALTAFVDDVDAEVVSGVAEFLATHADEVPAYASTTEVLKQRRA